MSMASMAGPATTRVTDDALADKYLTCAGDRSATKIIDRNGAGSYTIRQGWDACWQARSIADLDVRLSL